MLVIKRPQLDGPKPLDVERMEVLVAHEREPAKVPAGIRRSGRARGQQRRVLVLEASASLAKDVEEEISLEREEAPETTVLPHKFLELLRSLLAIPRSKLADINEQVLAAVDVEFMHRRVAGDDRRVDQRVIVIGAIVVGFVIGRRLERGHRFLPGRRKLEMNLVRPAGLLDQRDKRRRTIENAQGLADIVGRDRALLANEPVAHDDLGVAAGLDRPPILDGMLDFELRPSGAFAARSSTRLA